MSNNKNSKLEKWRKDYAALAVAIGCLYSVVVSWGDNWFMSALLSLGVIICGTIGFFYFKKGYLKSIQFNTNKRSQMTLREPTLLLQFGCL